jgi:hypothetical protein
VVLERPGISNRREWTTRSHLFFANFDLPAAPGDDQYGAWIAADDFMALRINIASNFTYNLDDHIGPDNQPIPIFVDFTDLLHAGNNIIEIEACDGNLACNDRLFEWVFFDAEHGPDEPPSFITPAAIPEPSSISLLCVAALAGWAFRKRIIRRNKN